MWNLFGESDENIVELIYSTHVHEEHEQSFDTESMFIVAENIIKNSTQLVDAIVQGSSVQMETTNAKQPRPNFVSPLCTLKSIATELCCKSPGEEIGHNSTLAILAKLSAYSWETKAVLALAAFALEFGDFWLLSHLKKSDELAKSLAILKKVPILLNPSELPKHRQEIVEVNGLVKAVLQVVEIIFELEKVTSYDPKDVPGLAQALDHIPAHVYWTIHAITACSTKISILTSKEQKHHDLAPYNQKINYILNKLKIQLIICKKQIEEAENYRKLKKLFRTPTEVMEIFKALIPNKDNSQPIVDCSTNKPVSLEVVKRKNVFWFISSLDITDEEIAILRPIHEETKNKKNKEKHEIVWVPIEEEWSEAKKKKFETVRSKMAWHAVQHFSPTASTIKFIREEWGFEGKPMVVSMSPRGRVENRDALHLMRVWGVNAFPFDKVAQERVSQEKNWIGHVVIKIDPIIDTWIKEEKYIFFYGGKDNEWTKQFAKKATILATDPTIKAEMVSIELFNVGKNLKGDEDLKALGLFWSGIESLFLTKAQSYREAKPINPTTHQVQSLLSMKNEHCGWAVLTRGSSLVVSGHGAAVLRAVEEFEKWRENVKGKGFERVFKEYYHNKVVVIAQNSPKPPCCRFDIPRTSIAGEAPQAMMCSECPRVMEMFVSYKCCHVDGPAGMHH